MVTRGKSINLYLMDGNPSGRIKCSLANWTGVVYKIPRIDLGRCKGRNDLTQSGVYCLFGVSDATGESVVYIGQAGSRKNSEGILCRLQEHKRNTGKDYWSEAVVFTTSNNSFGPTEISYLENRFTGMAQEAKRYIVKNANIPTMGNITEEKESELEEFIDYAKIVMGALGHKVFDAFVPSSIALPEDVVPALKQEQWLYCKRSGANAKAKLVSEGIVVVAGSELRKEMVPSCPDYVKVLRKQNQEYIDERCVLQRDILFKTPSGASAFVVLSSSNGNDDWKTAEGIPLKKLETSEVG